MEIGEIVDIKIHKSSHVHRVELTNKTKIDAGTRPEKQYWDANLVVGQGTGNEKKRGIKLVRRRMDIGYSDVIGQTASEKFVGIWEKLKEAGVPVLPSVIVLSQDEVLETDLTADGSQLYGKDSWHSNKPNTPADKFFLAINPSDIEKRAMEVAEIASKSQIKLSGDHGLDLIVHPDGKWEVMARDIKNTRLYESDIDKDWILGKNKLIVERFMSHIEDAIKHHSGQKIIF